MNMNTNTEESYQKSFLARRLERAKRHVNDLWFPINPQLLAKVQSGLEEGRYDFGMSFLVEDLKKDFALYTYCLKELVQTLHDEKIKVNIENPIQFLEIAGLHRIKHVLNVNPRMISPHDANSMKHFQAKQFEASIISASTAAAIAEKDEDDANKAYLTALLRQLGLTLIAWNYPSVYQRALNSATSTESLEDTLSEILGFSPLLLASAVVHDWDLAADITEAVQPPQKDPNEAQGNYLSKLCEVGEALARAQQPEIYPTAVSDWKTAREALQDSLGGDGLEIIRQNVREYCNEYLELNNEFFESSTYIDPEAAIHQNALKGILQRNPYAEKSPPLLRKKYEEYYHYLTTGPQMHDAISYIIKHIFPLAPFNGAHLFIVDVERSVLVPRLKVGFIKLSDYRTTRCDDADSPISMAFKCSTAIKGHSSKDELSYITGKLGTSPAIGALYMEFSTLLQIDSEINYNNAYKALRQAFHDAMGLK